MTNSAKQVKEAWDEVGGLSDENLFKVLREIEIRHYRISELYAVAELMRRYEKDRPWLKEVK